MKTFTQLAPGVVRIPTMGDFINSFAFLEADGSVTLVDCGLAKAPARIIRALRELGRDATDVQRIILTHAHEDHAAGAAEMVRESSVGGVEAHLDDAGFLRAGMSAPPNPRSRIHLPERRFPPVNVLTEFVEGDVIDAAGGLRVIHTPGHTPGHSSFLHEPTGILITGDCIFNPLGRQAWPLAMFCTSPEQNRASARRFADVEFDTAAFTHGPEIRSGARERIRSFLLRKGRD